MQRGTLKVAVWTLTLLLTTLTVLPAKAERRTDHPTAEIDGEIPPILYSTVYNEIATFVSADVAIEPDGSVNARVLDPTAQVVIRNNLQAHSGGCVLIEEVYVSSVNPADRSTLRRALRTSELVIRATVVARDYGFFQGPIPGQLLKVEVEEAIRGAARDWYYVFYPVAEFQAGPYRICKTDSRMPDPPGIGEQVLLMIPSVEDPSEPFLELGDEHSVVVLDGEGLARLPATFREGRADPVPKREDILKEVRQLTGRP